MVLKLIKEKKNIYIYREREKRISCKKFPNGAYNYLCIRSHRENKKWKD